MKDKDEMIMDEVVNVPSVQTPIINNDGAENAVVNPSNVDMSKYVRPRKTRTVIRKFDHKVGRNELCPCGSGKKYKNCCYDKYNETYELSASEMSQIRYGTKTPESFKKAINS